MTQRTLEVAIAPGESDDWAVEAVRAGGGQPSAPEHAAALVWTGKGPDGLEAVLQRGPDIDWVQLPSAGIESYREIIDDKRTWTCAKGIYSGAVAEHALTLALAGLHSLPQLARAHSWKKRLCRDLSGGTVTVLGGGGIARSLLHLLQPFGTTAIVVRRHPSPLPGAQQVVGLDNLEGALREADVVILALPLTAETEHIIGEARLHAMRQDAWLVNVGRGKLVDTEALVIALREGWIGGAALDVTDPEPLPPDHPLWDLDNCLITPHCANPPAHEREQYARLIRENIRHRIEGKPLAGLVDPHLGY